MKLFLILIIFSKIISANDTIDLNLVYANNLLNIYKYFPERYKKDKDFTIGVVDRYGELLEYADDTLKDDMDVINAGLKSYRHPLIIKYASYRIRDNKELMQKIIKESPHALKYASSRLKKDKEFIGMLILKNGKVLKYADKSLQNNPKFLNIALDNGLNNLAFASEEIQKNRDFALKLLSYSNYSIHTIHKSFYKDPIYMREAVKEYAYNIKYANNELKYDTTLALIALKEDITVHQILPKILKEKSIIKKYLQKNLTYLPKKITRKVKPKAWETYTVEDTLIELYGEDRNYTQNKDITIDRGEKLFSEWDEIKIKMSSKKDIKSIAILQEDENEKNSLVSLYYPKDGFVKSLSMQIKFKDNIWTSRHSFSPNFNLIIVLEDFNNKVYKYTYSYKISTCNKGEYREDDFLDRVKAHLNNPINSKVKIYHGMKGLKLRFTHPMISYNDAKSLNTKVNFISHIEAYRSKTKLFDFYTSEYISRDFEFRTSMKEFNDGKEITIVYWDIHGNVKTKIKETRKVK